MPNMKSKKLFNLMALIMGFSAVIVFTFYLITNWKYAIIFTEPNLFIRTTEVILGLISIPILFKMISKELKCK